MLQWVRLYGDINCDPRVHSVSLAAQAVYMRLWPTLNEQACLVAIPSRTVVETVAAVVHHEPAQIEPLLLELARVELLQILPDRVSIPKFIPRTARALAARETEGAGRAAGGGGEGSRGGRTGAERARDYRARKRGEAVTATDATENVASRPVASVTVEPVTDGVTGTVTATSRRDETVTRHGLNRDANRDETVTRRDAVTGADHQESEQVRLVTDGVTATVTARTALDQKRIEENRGESGARASQPVTPVTPTPPVGAPPPPAPAVRLLNRIDGEGLVEALCAGAGGPGAIKGILGCDAALVLRVREVCERRDWGEKQMRRVGEWLASPRVPAWVARKRDGEGLSMGWLLRENGQRFVELCDAALEDFVRRRDAVAAATAAAALASARPGPAAIVAATDPPTPLAAGTDGPL